MNIKRVSGLVAAGVLGISSVLAGGGNVSAIDLSSKLVATNLFGGDVASFNTTYNAETDVTTVETTLYLNDTAINSILAQRSGKGSSLGSGYIALDPNIDDSVSLWYKENTYFPVGTDIATEKAKVKEMLAADVEKGTSGAVSYDTIWPLGAYVLYKNSEGKFAMVSGEGDGKTSVADALVSALGLSSVDELVYGENFKVGMWTTYEWLDGWLAEGKTDEEPYWVLNTYKITYPIAGVVGSSTHASENYYKNLASALEGEENKVIVREDTTLDGDLVIPEGKTLEVTKDTTIALAKGAKVSGEITGEGRVTIDGIDYRQIANSISLGVGETEVKINNLNDTYYLRVFTEPDDAIADLEVTNSNSKVVKAVVECKADEVEDADPMLGECYNTLIVSGLEDGEAVITVTDKISGKSASVEVIVAQTTEWADAGNENASVYVEFGDALEGNLGLELETIELTDKLKAQSEYLKAVFDISVVDKDTGKIVSVKDNEIEVYLMLDLNDYKGMKYFKIVYIDDEGKIAEVFEPEVEFEEEIGFVGLAFTTTHLSAYGVLASATEFPTEVETPETGFATSEGASSAMDYRGLISTVIAMTVMAVSMEIGLYIRSKR